MEPNIITINSLSKQFPGTPSPAISDLTLLIPKCELIGLVGPDGAGKTTLIRLLTSLLHPTKGSILVDGHDTVQEASIIPSLIGYMPQKFGLYEDLTVMQNLLLYADLQGVLGKEREEMVHKLLAFTSLEPFTKRRARALSGGMKQKLGLACSLLRKPPLLLLDEPSVGVDPLSRRELWKMVTDLIQEGKTVIWSTSYLDEAEKCDRVLLLNEGKSIYFGPPKELTKRVEKKVFKVSGMKGSRRSAMSQALLEPEVIDGVIQGADIRLVLKTQKEETDPWPQLAQYPHISIKSAQPRFEDAFIDLLGGSSLGRSALADAVKEVPQERDYAVEVKGLTKKFGSFTAANNITFQVQRGEIFGLLGPNGAGKSTTFKMMCGLLKPTNGMALVNGIDLQTAPSEGRSQLGYMSQKFSLYGNMSVRQNLEFFAGINNVSKERKAKTIQLMVDIFGFSPFLEANAEALPLGYKQRLALSCAVMHNPKVLFLDEPTSGVDPITRREFWNHINGIVEKGATVVVTTHFMDEAEYCDKIGFVYRSNLIKMGTPDEIKASIATKERPFPTLEDAFIALIEQYERDHHE